MKKDGKEKEEMKEVAAIYREMANIIEEMAENEDEKKEEEIMERLIPKTIKLQMIQQRI